MAVGRSDMVRQQLGKVENEKNSFSSRDQIRSKIGTRATETITQRHFSFFIGRQGRRREEGTAESCRAERRRVITAGLFRAPC